MVGLEQGHALQEGKYIIVRLENRQDDILVYTGIQVMIQREVLIVESYPNNICSRDKNGHVTYNVNTHELDVIIATFKERVSTWMNSPLEVTVYDTFEENGTVYCVLSNLPSGFYSSDNEQTELVEAVVEDGVQNNNSNHDFSPSQTRNIPNEKISFNKKQITIFSSVVIIISLSVFLLHPFGYTYSKEQQVDLGLSVYWAGYNLGTTEPADTGYYYSWGETEPKFDYSEYTYQYGDSENCTYIGDDISGTGYDAATVTWGEGWRTPTLKEMRELLERCKWKWIEMKDMVGYLVTGPNGNSIFLPYAGHMESEFKCGICYYWTSTYKKEKYRTVNAWNLNLEYHENPTVDHIYQRRYVGRLIRPVKNK